MWAALARRGDGYTNMTGRKACKGTDGLRPDATLTMSTQTANAYWPGKVNLPSRTSSGQAQDREQRSGVAFVVYAREEVLLTGRRSPESDGRDEFVV